MTREEIATALAGHTKLHTTLDAAAAALRETCDKCQHYAVIDLGDDDFPMVVGQCYLARHAGTPADGSGYCHRFDPKETQ